jgi:hypothetical protein
MRGVFRVNYQENGQPKSGMVAAFTDVEAATHFGVASQSGVQVTKALYPVEVAGVDPAHTLIPSIPPSVAPFDLAKGVSKDEFNALAATVQDLQRKMAGQGTPVAPIVSPDQPGAAGTTPAKE